MKLSSAGVLGLMVGGNVSLLEAGNKSSKQLKEYSVVILGDTHFDTEPAAVYHSNYKKNSKAHLAEFARNGEMWRERLPRLVQRAADLIDEHVQMVFQMGDLVQGDCGKGEVHQKMLTDAMAALKKQLGPLPFVSVVGNHDIRGVDAKETYHSFMPEQMSQELGKEITGTTFFFTIGEDAYIFIDFNDPDADEIERCLKETEGARHTFIVVHGPVFPSDNGSARWFLYGAADENSTALRRRFRAEFARRNAMVLCGHTHRTEFYDWRGDGGRITQMTINSVWKPELDRYELITSSPADYGQFTKKDDKGVQELIDEYRSGLVAHTSSKAAGSYLLRVGKKHVFVDFYAGASQELTHAFQLK